MLLGSPVDKRGNCSLLIDNCSLIIQYLIR